MMNANTGPTDRSEVSSLMDGELDARRRQVLLTALHSDKGLRAAWSDYHMIGDALRGSAALQSDLTRCVMEGLRSEPVVLAPRALPERRLIRHAAALAASLAGVSVVAWLVLQSGQPGSGPAPSSLPRQAPLAAAVALSPAVAVASVAGAQNPADPKISANSMSPATAGRMQEYLLAHQAYSPINRFDGGTGYIRTVSANR